MTMKEWRKHYKYLTPSSFGRHNKNIDIHRHQKLQELFYTLYRSYTTGKYFIVDIKRDGVILPLTFYFIVLLQDMHVQQVKPNLNKLEDFMTTSQNRFF